MTGTSHIQPSIAFILRHELAAVKQALKAVRDCIDLKREIGLPLLPETRQAIDELEGMVSSLKLELLRLPHADQMVLPGMEDIGGMEPVAAS